MSGQTVTTVVVPPVKKRRITATPYVWRPPEEIPPRAWLYGRHYIRKFLSATVAPGAAGKSSLLLLEAVAMATGRPLLNVAIRAPLRVWVWNGEDPIEELERRLAAIMLHYGVTHGDLCHNLFLDSGRARDLIIATGLRDGAVIHEAVVDDVKAAITEHRIDVFIVDPFVTTHAVSENDNGQIATVAKTWAQIADATNCAIELVHHVRKGSNGSTGGDLSADDARGAGALVAAARSVRVINTMTTKEAEKADIDSPRSYFRTDDGKANLAPPEAARWHRLVSTDLGNATDDQPSDQVAVVTTWQWPDPFDEVTVHHLREVQKRIAPGAARLDGQAKEWVGHIIADVIGVDLSDKAAKAAVKMIIKTWIANDVLRTMTKPDDKRRPREYVVPGAPA